MKSKLCLLVAAVAALVASVAPAQTWNMNVDWKFTKLN